MTIGPAAEVDWWPAAMAAKGPEEKTRSDLFS